MKIILQQNVQKLGKAGDVVEASPGFFRNFLQPRKLAVLATDGTLKKREEDLAALRKKAEASHQTSVDLAERINALDTIRLTAKAGEGGRLYGKITNKEIAQVIEEKLNIQLDKKLVKPVDDISSLGLFKVDVKLAAEVHAHVTVEVALEGAPIRAKPAAPASETEVADSGEEVAAEESLEEPVEEPV